MATTISTNHRPLLVVIVGPTGSGKSGLAVALARHFGAEIISTDSRQFYQGMAIGTAQPTAEELAMARHHFIADRLPESELSAGGYEREALARLDEIFARHNMAIAVGGSGLYIDALCYGFDALPSDTAEVRAELMRRLDEEGLEALVEELRLRDEAYWAIVDRRNPSRVIRALEVCIASGRPYSEQRTRARKQRPFDVVKLAIDYPRAELYERIDRRVDQMMADGLEAEARRLYPLRGLNSLQTVGYRELFDHFDGTLSLTEAVELVKRNSRRYAKRQLTWFRRDETVEWISLAEVPLAERADHLLSRAIDIVSAALAGR